MALVDLARVAWHSNDMANPNGAKQTSLVMPLCGGVEHTMMYTSTFHRYARNERKEEGSKWKEVVAGGIQWMKLKAHTLEKGAHKAFIPLLKTLIFFL
jgi:hypothetical protein